MATDLRSTTVQTDVVDLPSRVLRVSVVSMKRIIVVSLILGLTGCGGGGSGGSDSATTRESSSSPSTPSPVISYEISQPLVDNSGEQSLESRAWTHIVLQAQKYSSSGTVAYPTTAAQRWIRGSKSVGATAILFPEHPRRGNTTEGQAIYNLHYGIAQNENACVAPVGPVWDEALLRYPNLVLHAEDGNHASTAGNFLTALVLYQIITGQLADAIPDITEIGIDSDTQQLLRDTVTSILFLYRPCNYEA